jgi:large repetitive protein
VSASATPAQLATVTVINNGAGAYTLNITPAQEGAGTVTVSASDGTYTSTRSFTLNITPAVPNEAPVLGCGSGPLPATIRGAVAYQSYRGVCFTDANNPAETSFTVTAVSSNQSVLPAASINVGTASLSEGKYYVGIDFTPASAGTTNLTVTVSDGQGGQATHTYALTVVASNTAPVVQDIPDLTMTMGTPLNIPFTATDPDGDPITFDHELWSGIATMSISGSNGSYVMTLTPVQVGTDDHVLLHVSDGIETTYEGFKLIVQ